MVSGDTKRLWPSLRVRPSRAPEKVTVELELEGSICWNAREKTLTRYRKQHMKI